MKSEMAEAGRATAPIEANPRLKDTSMGLVDYGVIPESRRGQEASMHRVLIVGGGAGGLELATRLGDSLGRRGKASIALLDKTRVHVWKPHLHEIASGTLDIEVDSVEYLARARAHHYRFRIGAMCGLDREERQVFVEPTLDEDGRQLIPPRVLGYDTLIIAVGSAGNDFDTPGVKEHAIAIDSAQTAHQMASLVEKAVSARLKQKALPKFRYRDFGNLVNLSEYGTVGNLVGLVGKRSVYLEGVFARLMYRSLYKMHQRALHGMLKTTLDTAADLISRRTEPRVKLH
jgi:NADH dehydrogenase FAD-containing subunit